LSNRFPLLVLREPVFPSSIGWCLLLVGAKRLCWITLSLSYFSKTAGPSPPHRAPDGTLWTSVLFASFPPLAFRIDFFYPRYSRHCPASSLFRRRSPSKATLFARQAAGLRQPAFLPPSAFLIVACPKQTSARSLLPTERILDSDRETQTGLNLRRRQSTRHDASLSPPTLARRE